MGNGVVSDVKSGKALANFTRRMYGDPLGPREQRSFRYPFVPSKKLSPGEYQMTFSVFYANRDKQPFSTVVYNEKNVLVAGPPEKSELPLTEIAMAAAARGRGALFDDRATGRRKPAHRSAELSARFAGEPRPEDVQRHQDQRRRVGREERQGSCQLHPPHA